MPDYSERRQNDVELALLRKDVEQLTDRVGELTDQVSGLVRAWETAGYIVSIVRQRHQCFQRLRRASRGSHGYLRRSEWREVFGV